MSLTPRIDALVAADGCCDAAPRLVELSKAIEAALSELASAVSRYDAAIAACANDPEKMASFCSAEGDDLDALYMAMVNRARDASNP